MVQVPCSLLRQLSQQSTSTFQVIICLLKRSTGFRFVSLDFPMLVISVILSSLFQTCKYIWYTVISEQLSNHVFWPWTQCTCMFSGSWYPAVRRSKFLCLSHTMPGYNMNVITADGWCFALHKQHGKHRLSVSSENTSQKMFIGNDTISETVNDLGSDDGNFIEHSDSNTC
jgi:hypothetical protein